MRITNYFDLWTLAVFEGNIGPGVVGTVYHSNNQITGLPPPPSNIIKRPVLVLETKSGVYLRGS